MTQRTNPFDAPNHGSAVLDPVSTPVRAKPPTLFDVVMKDDDFTPMDFVVEVLQGIFALSNEKSVAVMLAVHEKGEGVAGRYPQDIAATKVDQVKAIASHYGHPLMCLLRPVA